AVVWQRSRAASSERSICSCCKIQRKHFGPQFMNPPKNVAVLCIIQGGELMVCGVTRAALQPALPRTPVLIEPGSLTTTPRFSMINNTRGAVAQLGERYYRTVEVEGSSPFGSTIIR